MSDDLISAIYGGPFGRPPWECALPRLRRLTNSTRLMLKFNPVDAIDDGLIYTDSGASRREWEYGGSAEVYRRIYQYKDPVRYENMARGDIRQLDELIDRRAFTRSDYYRQLCGPLDINQAFFFYLGRWCGVDAWLNGSRGAAQGPYSGEEIATARSLFPHLSRAAQIHCQMTQHRAEAAIYAQGVSALGVGMLMLDRRGAILGGNAEAQEILDEGSPVFRAGGRIGLVGEAQQSYAALLERLINAGEPAMSALTASDGESSVEVLVRRVESLIAPKTGGATAFVVYLNRAKPVLTDGSVDFVSKTFGLTKTEARLSVLLASGLSIDDIAHRLGVTRTTARTYCKSALAKTGAPRQAELVRRVLQSLARLA